jgi:2-dehydropantoate 2-reductase
VIWHLLGAGAMGSLAASYLRRAGFDVVVPGQSPGCLTRELHFPDGRTQLLDLPVVSPERITHLLLATKAGQTQAALSPWLNHLAADATLVCLQNGMGQLDDVGLPAGVTVLPAITTSGAYRNAERITVVAENTTFMGDGAPVAPGWFGPLASVWPGLKWAEDIRQRQLAKLAVNALINPLTALHRCNNGDLLASAIYPELAALASEVDAILTALDAGWPGDALARAEQVARLTAANTSSMLADVLAGRATEIAFINGWLVREAARLGVAAPLNLALLEQLAEPDSHPGLW